MFKNDAFLWYSVGEWKELGLAVPNWSNDEFSQNETIRYLCEVMGRNLQTIMFHTDARLRVPPSINTLTRIHKLVTRSRSILASRQVPANKPNMENQHSSPSPEVFLVYPTPYFKVRNQWLKQYCGLILTSLTEAMQHTENTKALEISESFAGTVGQYLHRVYRLMAVELFRVPLTEAEDPTFTLTDEQLKSYDPTSWFTSTEMNDTVPRFEMIPTEDDMEVITNGIPVTHIPNLGRWPSSVGIGDGPKSVSDTKTAPVESFAPAPGP